MSDEQTSQVEEPTPETPPDEGDPWGIGLNEPDPDSSVAEPDDIDAFEQALKEVEAAESGEVPEAEEQPEEKAGDKPEDDAKAAAETEKEAETEPEKEAQAPEPVFDVMAALSQEAPGAVVDKVEDLPKYVADLHEQIMGYRKFEDAFEKSEYYREFTKLILEGEPEWKAAAKAFRPLLNAPDPDEDPEAAAEWDKNMAVLAAEEKAAAKERAGKADRDAQLAERRAQMWNNQLLALAKENGWDEKTMQAEAQKINALVLGDTITGHLSAGAVKRLHQATKIEALFAEKEAEHQKALKAEYERGKVEGIESVRKAKSKGPTVPEFAGSGGEGELTDEQKQHRKLLEEIGVLDDDSSDFDRMVDKAFS